MTSLLDEFSRIVQAFENAGIEYAVCGGLAMAIQGYPRATMDIDLLIREPSLDDALRVAVENGFDIQQRDASFKRPQPRIRRVSKVIEGVILGLDMVLVIDEIEEAWESKEQVAFQGHPTTVVSRSGLISLKRRAGRPQDLADIWRMENEEDITGKTVNGSLHQVNQLHALSVSLLKAGLTHYEKLINEGKATNKELARFRKYLV